MTREQILEFLNVNPVCHLATCEGKQPQVRGMMMYRADASGLISSTGIGKALNTLVPVEDRAGLICG